MRKKEIKISKETLNECRHVGTSVHGNKYGYCMAHDCCDYCNKRVRLGCKVISWIESKQSMFVEKICK